MSADADSDRLPFDFQFGVNADVVLHAARGIHRIVGRGEGGHDFIANGLDHGSFMQLRRGTHDVHAHEDHVTSASVSHYLIDMGASDHVGEQYC